MARKKKMSFEDLVSFCKANGVEEAEVDGMKVKITPHTPDSALPEKVEFPEDHKTNELESLLYSADISLDEIKNYTR